MVAPVVDPSLLDPVTLGTFLNDPAIDIDRATLMLTLACNACSVVLDPLPATALAVVLAVATRGYTNPEATTSETTGNSSRTVAVGMNLLPSERQSLELLGGRSGAFSINPLAANAGCGMPWWDRNEINAGIVLDELVE